MTFLQDANADLSKVGTSVSEVFNNLLSGLETSIVAVVLAVLAVFMPQLIALTSKDLLAIGNNFRLFLSQIGNGTPWGTALADMLTADWNETSEDAKMIGTDFAEAVANALQHFGVLPQGK